MCQIPTESYPQKKFSSLAPSFDPEGVMCVGIDVGGLNLEDVRWHRAICLDAHVFVDNRCWKTLAFGLRSADTATANIQLWQSLWNWQRLWQRNKRTEKYLLTFQRFWCKGPRSGFWNSSGSLHNSSSTFHHLGSYGSLSHTHLCLVIGRVTEKEGGGTEKSKIAGWQT